MPTRPTLRFARTKIQPPRQRPGLLLARPALEARVAEALSTVRLVLVCAAAGYGKTSLLASQVAALPAGTALAWVSCDAGDLPQRLLECLVGALEPHDLPWRVEPESLLAGSWDDGTPETRHRGLANMAAELIDALDACDVPHGVIVIDDLHRVAHPAVHEFLDLLLARFTPRWTLAIASRHEPPIALARLRAHGDLAEFRLDDLRFVRDEARAMVAPAGLDATAADALFDRTQGWPVALRLGMHVHAGSNSGPPVGLQAMPLSRPQASLQLGQQAAASALRTPALDRAMFEFLAADVFDQLPPDLLDFLLKTSVLPELDASRCAALTGDAQALRKLERIERSGIAVSTVFGIDPNGIEPAGSELTLRLHDLVREALERRLLREQPETLPDLCARAAAGEPEPGRRIDFLLRAGDHAAAAEALAVHAPMLLTHGEMAAVQRLLDRFPPGWADASPALHHVRGLLGWARWDFVAMQRAMQRAEAACLAAGDADGALRALGYRWIAESALGVSQAVGTPLPASARQLETRLIVLLASTWRALDVGELHLVGPLLDDTLDLLESTRDLSLWYRAHTVPRLNGLPGTDRALDRYVDGVMRLTADAPSPLRAMATTQQVLRSLWQGRTDEAGEALDAARADARWLGHPPNVAGMMNLAELLYAVQRGERDVALAAARRLIDEHMTRRGAWSLASDLFMAARAAAAFDDAGALDDFLARLEVLQPRLPTAVEKLLRPLHGMRSALAGDVAGAASTWARSVADEARSDWLGSAVEIRLRLAATQLAQGDDAAAVATLQPAAERVVAHAGVNGVLMARSALAALAGAASAGRLGAPLGRTVLGWHRLMTSAGAARPSAPAPTESGGATDAAGGLSGRELEVLQRIAAGDSNKLIARAFDLSPHTVKRHVANILDKLALRSRGQAAAWYRDHAGR